MGLERQFNYFQPMPNENRGSVLPNIAERAKEVIPVQYRSRIVCSLSVVNHPHDLRFSPTCEILSSALGSTPTILNAIPTQAPQDKNGSSDDRYGDAQETVRDETLLPGFATVAC